MASELDQSDPEKRVLFGPGIFAEPNSARILFPVPNDGWFPLFRCGEFAVVETSMDELEAKHFYLRSSKYDGPSIVRLEQVDKKAWGITGPGSRGILWKVVYPAQTARRLDGGVAEEFGLNGRFHMCDGPAPDKHLRSQIIGRVTGVLGAGNRSLNWMGRGPQ